ncbi:hypothetical protein MPSEU_000208400 [Mayamaea pseudoterrestris]|nr:hypothetical protein MPSEU_000208400 [Mayamaea pseudoterrestris]
MARERGNGGRRQARGNVAEPERSVAEHVRERQRFVAEREANRLARPEEQPQANLDHANRKLSGVSTTPRGMLIKKGAGSNHLSQEWCGPFSVARQMIAKREEARLEREAELDEAQGNHPLDQVMLDLANEQKRKAHPALQWKSRPNLTNGDSIYAKRQKRQDVKLNEQKIPSLFQLCTRFLVDNFDCVDALGNVDSSIRAAIAKELVGSNKLDAQAFHAIAEVGIEALELVDCSSITQEDLCDSLEKLLPSGLRFLVLDQCGRCFGPQAANLIVKARVKNLFALAIGGAYVLSDADAASLVRTLSSTLSSIEFKACPMLGKETASAISESYSSATSAKLLELTLEDLPLDAESIASLTAIPAAFQNIQSLGLRFVDGLTDQNVDEILRMSGPTLEALDLSGNHQLTDSILSSIRQNCSGLRSLSLEGLKQLSSEGLEALFLHVPGMALPPMLRRLNLANCDHEAVSDEVIQLATQAAIRRQGDTDVHVANMLGGLVFLNIQGSTRLTDIGLEHLVHACGDSLVEVNFSFCTTVTDKGLGYLVDKCGNQLSKVQIWGNAQLSDEFLDGHRRVDDPNVEVVGAWIKKSTSRSVR